VGSEGRPRLRACCRSLSRLRLRCQPHSRYFHLEETPLHLQSQKVITHFTKAASVSRLRAPGLFQTLLAGLGLQYRPLCPTNPPHLPSSLGTADNSAASASASLARKLGNDDARAALRMVQADPRGLRGSLKRRFAKPDSKEAIRSVSKHAVWACVLVLALRATQMCHTALWRSMRLSFVVQKQQPCH
jgi:hypothetical protein